MMRVLAYLSFIGTRYHGFQVQQNAVTVQSVFQQALGVLCKPLPDIKGCSRTDSGVHANMYCVSFDCGIEPRKLVAGLNALLPPDVRVLRAVRVPDGFHARYDCVKKRYVYLISDAPVMSPFLYGRALDFDRPIDCGAADALARVFEGRHDFSAFCGAAGRRDDSVRTVYECRVERHEGLVRVSVTADGFLYNMVRIIVGTLLSGARGKLCAADIERALLTGERTALNITAPAHGLYLDEVFYDFED